MWNKFRRLFREWGIVAIAIPSVAGLTILLRWAGGLQFLEWAALDYFMRWRPAEPTDPRIVIVAIDESDLENIGQWPMSDATLARLLRNIQAQQPRAIGLDLYRNLPVPPGHSELVEVFENTPNLIGIEKVTGKARGKSVAPPPALSRLDRVGAADLVIDSDGKVRRALLGVRIKESGEEKISFAERLALIYLAAEGIYPEVLDAQQGKVKLGREIFVPMQPNDGGYVRAQTQGYQILLNSRHLPCRNAEKGCAAFPTVSMGDVLDGRLPSDTFRDRVVLIGTTAPSLQDFFFTSYPAAVPGVEIHADITSLLLSAALEGRAPLAVLPEVWEWWWILLWSGAGATLVWKLPRLYWKTSCLAIASLGLVGGTYGLFVAGWWLPAIPALLALNVAGGTVACYLLFVERNARQAMMNLLGQHVSPEIAQAVWRDRQQLLKQGQILGQKMVATVLFTDLKGFTSISEQTEPETLMFWLNDYMNSMSQIVLDRGGVVDKFIGDAIMAVFGVPIPSTTEEEIGRDAIAAVSCAVEMAAELRSLNQQWRSRGLPTAAMRVGIATGVVVAGSLGSQKRLNYTTIGDSVNVAARLESYDKSIDGGICRVLIGEETHRYLQGQFPTQFVDVAHLRGKTKSVKVYQVLID